MAEHGPAEGPRVLLVDDDAGAVALLREALEAEGLVVVGDATDGASGVELAGILRAHVVLMDLRMPGMDGFEATRLIRARYPETQVIILTAYEELLTESAEAVGAFAYLVKGCPAALMRDMIIKAWRRAIG